MLRRRTILPGRRKDEVNLPIDAWRTERFGSAAESVGAAFDRILKLRNR